MAERELSVSELRDLYRRYERALLDLGFTRFERRLGTDDWQRLMCKVKEQWDPEVNINPALEADANPEINQATGLCIIGYVGDEAVAGVCARSYPNVTNFARWLEKGRMWAPPHRAVECDWEPVDPQFDIKGHLVQVGGLFIRKGVVKRGGAKFLARMMRIAVVLGWETPPVDHIIGLLSDSTYRRFPEGNAGCKPVGIVARGLAIGCPPTDFWLTHAEAQEGLMLDGYEHDNPSDTAVVV